MQGFLRAGGYSDFFYFQILTSILFVIAKIVLPANRSLAAKLISTSDLINGKYRSVNTLKHKVTSYLAAVITNA